MNYILIFFLIFITVIFVLGIRRAHVMSKKSVELINKYEYNKNSHELIEEIFEFISKDFLLSRILKKNNASLEDISKLHSKLMEWGDFRKYNRYVPITSFFNASALDYLLKHKADNSKTLTEKMMNHFHI